jgi:hypothetical protein
VLKTLLEFTIRSQSVASRISPLSSTMPGTLNLDPHARFEVD